MAGKTRRSVGLNDAECGGSKVWRVTSGAGCFQIRLAGNPFRRPKAKAPFYQELQWNSNSELDSTTEDYGITSCAGIWS